MLDTVNKNDLAKTLLPISDSYLEILKFAYPIVIKNEKKITRIFKLILNLLLFIFKIYFLK